MIDTNTADCAMCGTEQPCMTSDDISICADRTACEARLGAALDEAFERTWAMRNAPLPNEERYIGHRPSDPEIAPCDYTDIDRATCYMCDRADCICDSIEPPIDIPSVLEVDEPDSEFYAQAERPAPTRVNWSEGPVLSPVRALRLALDKGAFGPQTLATLRAALEAADREALTNAEQLAAARAHAAINLEMRKIEAAIFDLPC